MKMLRHDRFGPPEEVLELAPMGDIVPDVGEALVAIEATPIHPGDLYNIEGQPVMIRNVTSGDELGVELPQIPGIEGVGRICAVGSGVAKKRLGERVLLPFQCGSWRSHINARAESLINMPEDGEAAQLALMVNALTAELALADLVALERGDWIAQNCANSSVGRYLIALARGRGVRTVNIVRRQEVADELRALGADVVVVDGEDLAGRVRDATRGANIKLGLDGVAGEATARLGRCLADGAVLANYGLMSNEACRIPTWMLLYKQLSVRGYYMGFNRRRRSRDEQRAIIQGLASKIAAREISAKVAASYGLEDYLQAIDHARSADRDGKVVFVP